jgi:multidrug efflux pump subunit AcrB
LFVGEMNTADDLFKVNLSAMTAQFGGGSTRIDPAGIFNTILQVDTLNASQLPAVAQLLIVPLQNGLDANKLIGEVSPEVITYINQHDPKFLWQLTPGVYESFSDAVLKLPQVAPPLADTWKTLAERPQFKASGLANAADVVTLGDGKASQVLNTINQTVPKNFAGYEVRLFDSLSTGTLRYFAAQEADFYKSLDAEVLKKLSPAALKQLPAQALNGMDAATTATLQAIAEGKQDSAAKQLASLYTTDLPPADPSAPAINSDWGLVANFFGIELNTADDFFRFPANFPFKTPAAFMNNMFSTPQGAAFAPNLFGKMPKDAVAYMLKRDAKVFDELQTEGLQLLPKDVLSALPQDLQDRATSGGTPFKPTAAVTRTNGNNSYLVTIYKDRTANTVEAFHKVEEKLKEIQSKDQAITVGTAFEQASFIEESIAGVAREGGLGGVFAIVVILIFLSTGLWARSPRRTTGIILLVLFVALLALIVITGINTAGGDASKAFAGEAILLPAMLGLGALAGLLILIWPGNLPYPAWRSTLVVAVSIPLSLCIALAVMKWVPPFMHDLLAPGAETSPLLGFIIRLFPASITINIMTLSGLTVAIGRVVDDSIVVLENIFRHIQEGEDKRQAIISGARDVSVAIFSATVITVVVFLPLGLTGGIISEFFLPFGLAVTYSLLASFVVAITVVPVMAYLFISRSDVGGTEHNSIMERAYLPVLKWALASGRNKAIVLVVALVSLGIGGALFGTRPQTFIPGLGEPQISVAISLPAGTKIADTNTKVAELEQYVQTAAKADVSKVQTIVGSGGASFESLLLGGSSVSENIANLTIGVEDQAKLDNWAQQIRSKAEDIFGKENVKVSAASISDQGFGSFALVLSGPQDQLAAFNQKVLDTLKGTPGLANVASNLAVASGDADTPTSYIRIDGESAVRYTAELEGQDTLGMTAKAIEAITKLPDLPKDVKVSQGFESQLQTEGFRGVGVAMIIALVIVVIVLIVTFRSFVHWLDIVLSIVVAPVGAAVALTLTDRVLGISAMIGLLMLIGIVVTNAVVLIDRVQSNRRERGMSVRDALIEAGDRRLRPILMTALATIFALLPLAIGLSKGAIIASELGTVVIGGLFSSTLLTLIIVPVAYSLLARERKSVS